MNVTTLQSDQTSVEVALPSVTPAAANDSIARRERAPIGASKRASKRSLILKGRVKADPEQIEQVIMNLAFTARDAMPDGGMLTIATANLDLNQNCTLERPEVQGSHYVLLSVNDQGCGMTEAVKACIFEPFFTTKRQGKGTGLGLATIYCLVKQSGGHISAHSKPEQGMIFEIFLPQIREDLAVENSSHDLKPVPNGKETILLVEDDDAIRALTHFILDLQGYHVVESRNGEEALELAKRHVGTINLLLTDIVMSGMGGRVLADRLTQTVAGIKILFISGYPDDVVLRHRIPGEAAPFLQKPFTPTSLTNKVREVLDM